MANGNEVTYREAVRTALADAMREDPRVVLLGEEIAHTGGTFKTTVGLMEEFGPQRVIDTPISETGFTGAALGMAITGLRPVVEIMFADFLLVTMDQVVNSIAKYRYMSGGQTSVPLTLRVVGGGGLRFGSQHSATAESWLLPFAGLKIYCPATPADAYALLREAIRDDDPVVVLEHKALYASRGPLVSVPEPDAPWRVRVLRAGRDATVAATLAMVPRSLAAAEILASQGVEAEVMAIPALRPFDVDGLVASVRRTKRLFLVAEEPLWAGWTGTVATLVVQRAFDSIESPPEAITLPEAPMPFSPVLEDACLPSAQAIARRVLDSLA